MITFNFEIMIMIIAGLIFLSFCFGFFAAVLMAEEKRNSEKEEEGRRAAAQQRHTGRKGRPLHNSGTPNG